MSSRILPISCCACGLLTASLQSQAVLHSMHGGPIQLQQFGTALSCADIDGDGTKDLLVGAPLRGTPTFPQNGVVWAFSGRDGTFRVLARGDRPNSRLGSVVAGIGDINGDRREDFIMASPTDDRGGPGAGAALIISGRDGTALRRHVGERGTGFGAAAIGLDDLDNDGVEDYAISAPFDSPTNGLSVVRVYSGRNGVTLRSFFSFFSNSRFGTSLARVPDMDNDRRTELAIGAPLSNTVSSRRAGSVTVYSSNLARNRFLTQVTGRSALSEIGHTLASPGDVNADGTPEILAGNPSANQGRGVVGLYSLATGRRIQVFGGRVAGARLGAAIASAGDHDRDGTADFAFGAPGDQRSGITFGSVSVYSGRTHRVLSVSVGSEAGEAYGNAVTNLGDLDGDRVPELGIGAPLSDSQARDAGRAVVIRRVFSPLFRHFGNECRPAGNPILGHNGQLPHVGRTTIFNALLLQPNGAAIFLIGSSNTQLGAARLPLALDALGMTGCHLYVSSEMAIPRPVNRSGQTSLPVSLPNEAAMAGRRFFLQVMATDRGNAAGLIATGGVECVIGRS